MTTTVSGNSGGTAVTTTTLPTLIPGFLFGLTLSTAGSSATFSIASGAAVNSLATGYMTLASAYTKTTSAWALGSAAGALDTGAIANSTWYHVYLIQRVDTGVVDVLISLSATAPTMPTNYTLFRRIGSMKTNGSAQWTSFMQVGGYFRWVTPVIDGNPMAATTAFAALTISVPLGVSVLAVGNIATVTNGNVASIRPVGAADGTPSITTGALSLVGVGGSASSGSSQWSVVTNTSAQVEVAASTAMNVYVATTGWIDSRGGDA